jgi:hypothetical protein
MDVSCERNGITLLTTIIFDFVGITLVGIDERWNEKNMDLLETILLLLIDLITCIGS